jgi:hypothetical protein
MKVAFTVDEAGLEGLNIAAHMLVSTARPSSRQSPPACASGVGDSIQKAELSAAADDPHRNIVEAAETLFLPNRTMPRKLDSTKNESRPSAARGAPKMLPTNREYADQFVPKANSMVSPVATPAAKVAAKSLVHRSTAARSDSSPLRR